MIHHECIVALLADEDGQAGKFDVIEEEGSQFPAFQVFDQGAGLTVDRLPSLENAYTEAHRRALKWDAQKLQTMIPAVDPATREKQFFALLACVLHAARDSNHGDRMGSHYAGEACSNVAWTSTQSIIDAGLDKILADHF